VLSVDDAECVRGVGLRVRRPPAAPVVDAADADDRFPPPGTLAPMQGRAEIEESVRAGLISGINLGLEIRPARGSWLEPGPAACWFRLLAPLVAGEETTPLARAMVAADFANGISSELSFDEHVFINPDLTVHLWRLPVGEWVALDAVTHLSPGAGAISTGVLRDESGALGRSTQSLYVAER
jgi:hypothetical protein